MRFCVAITVLLLVLVPNDVRGETFERGLAVTDLQTLHELDGERLGLNRMLGLSRAAPLTNDALFALPSMAPLRRALDAEFKRYIERHEATLPRETIGIGAPHDFQLFDSSKLYSADTRFVLAGIINRMDRAYVAPETCGEIRLIYRLTQIGETAPSRLPMTLNLVLRARLPADTLGCAEIARRWLASDPPLALLTSDQIDRIETNLQIAHAPKSASREFRTDYLQKVFRYDPANRNFVEAPLENQIDRDRLLGDAALAQDFKAWLLAPENLAVFDAGTILIPDRFLATGSVASTPAGLARSALQPSFGLMQSDDAGRHAVFTDDDVVTALRASARGIALQNIRSLAGFARRLNDISCGGCHQVRGIGGFHFPGADALAPASSTAVVPASPHFTGDQPRRRDILNAMRDGIAPDYSRGFSDRPQLPRSHALAGSEVLDGWGATCYRPRAKPADNDASFKLWNCAEGLSCQPVGADEMAHIGMCFVK
ncbi:hypothetical protein [Tardiphaga sp.]|uniref:hypothetical protein n=1 Tax=Tardiphaga sp. TaxID=1926292 RepID=UPI002628CA4D|nr:hypothetical protein [Tardiphaga sp.]MDB5619432.1 hypothetical protein [Tardiphaga sp.]